MDRAELSPQRPRPMAASLPVGTDPASVRRRIEAAEKLLEHGFKIPGVRYEFGLDAIVGLIPVIGDVVGAAFGAYLVWEAKNLGMPKWKLWRMAGNVGFDTAVGLVPFAGDALDFLFRSNTRNLKVVKRHLDKHHPHTRVIEG
jgi:hypothetical protein